MEITSSRITDPLSVSIFHLHGKLDGSNYRDLIDAAQKEYDAGARRLVLDCADLSFISSAGLSAFHTIGKIFRGQSPADQQEGWASFHAMEGDRGRSPQEYVKLLNTVPDVQKILDLVGFNALFSTYTSFDEAIASFNIKPRQEISVS